MFEILFTILYGILICLLLLMLQIPKPIIKIINKLKIKEVIIEEVYDSKTIILQQDLFKLGAKELFLSWKLRHIIIIGNVIKYYSIPYHEHDTPVGEFDMVGCYVRKADVEECCKVYIYYIYKTYT